MDAKNFEENEIKAISYAAYRLDQALQRGGQTDREQLKTSFTMNLLLEIGNNAIGWSEACQFSMKHFYPDFLRKINSFIEREQTIPTDDFFVVSLKFYYEFYLFNLMQENPHSEHYMIPIAKKILNDEKKLFPEIIDSLQFIKNELPFLILRENPISHTQKSIANEARDLHEKIEKITSGLESKKNLAEALSKKFEGISDNYNFVGLHMGFSRMYREKEKERTLSTISVIFFGSLAFLIAWAAIVLSGFYFNPNNSPNEKIINLIPFIGAEIIALYFFRLAYTESKSIKNQILQLKLRMTLCQFIQRYASYAKELGENNSSLEKFENIIFSGIVSDPNSIPSTFDGMDQLGNLIEKFNKPR